jgi:hypothetical protein
MWDFRDDSKICDDKLVVAVEQDGGVLSTAEKDILENRSRGAPQDPTAFLFAAPKGRDDTHGLFFGIYYGKGYRPMHYPDFETFRRLAGGKPHPVYREILADTENPGHGPDETAAPPSVFLLESVEGGEKWGRYTFLGADPRKDPAHPGTGVLVEENGETKTIAHGATPLP